MGWLGGPNEPENLGCPLWMFPYYIFYFPLQTWPRYIQWTNLFDWAVYSLAIILVIDVGADSQETGIRTVSL